MGRIIVIYPVREIAIITMFLVSFPLVINLLELFLWISLPINEKSPQSYTCDVQGGKGERAKAKSFFMWGSKGVVG